VFVAPGAVVETAAAQKTVIIVKVELQERAHRRKWEWAAMCSTGREAKYNLWNQKPSLLNVTDIPYRRLLIPCCTRCNNEPLAQLENEVSSLLLQPSGL
jgi:hypothetical protein